MIACRSSFEKTASQWIDTPIQALEDGTYYTMAASQTRSLESARSKGLAAVLTLTEAVEMMETKLCIRDRWTEECNEWKEASKNADMQAYDCAVDHLEGLVVARLFELSKMNRAGTSTSTLWK